MKGLDGIQGPIYVGTGCVFRRQALYGYDAPKTKKPPTRTCNCWPKWCCCGGRKKKKKTNKPKSELKKRNSRKADAGGHVPVCALEGIEEGIEGKYFASKREVFNNLAIQLVVLALTYAALTFASWFSLNILLISSSHQIYPSWLVFADKFRK